MYSPTTRLLTMLEMLQSRKHMSGSEMAQRLEVDVRTVRRYVVMLQDMGIPVEAERGPYGAYQLQRGYKLPPLMFTDAEAVALTLGLIAIRELKFPVDVAAVEGALAKTERVMPEKLYNQARGLREAITFFVSLPPALFQSDYLALLSSAVRGRQQVIMGYRSYNGEDLRRAFDPYGIVFNEGYWYTAGFCHLRQDVRTFRLDRITGLEEGTAHFERPDDFDALAYVIQSLASRTTNEYIEILLQAPMEKVRQYFTQVMGTLEETPDGILFRRAASQLEWIAHVLLMIDFPVKMIRGGALPDILRGMAAKAAQLATNSG